MKLEVKIAIGFVVAGLLASIAFGQELSEAIYFEATEVRFIDSFGDPFLVIGLNPVQEVTGIQATSVVHFLSIMDENKLDVMSKVCAHWHQHGPPGSTKSCVIVQI